MTKSGNRQDLETFLGSSKVLLELGLGLGLGIGFLSSGERSMPSPVQKKRPCPFIPVDPGYDANLLAMEIPSGLAV